MDYPGKVITKNQVTPTQSSAPGVWTLDDAASAVKNNNWPVAGVPNPISKSLRFNSADSAYLNRTPGAAGNRDTMTFSFWAKISTLYTSSRIRLFSQYYSGAANQFWISFDTSANVLDVASRTSSVFTLNLITTQVFRDVSAWGHFVIAIDTTQATNTNRAKIYYNGVQITAFSTATYPSQNTDMEWNNTETHYISSRDGTTEFYNGYMTEINFIDGQALTPSSFGMTDPQTGAWVPVKYTGTYGTNGFYLNFKDATSTSALGYDYSGNSNNWTTNNFSVTAGAGNDSLTDVPTPWFAYNTTGDVGGVFRGNYSTFNPLDCIGTSGLSNGNLDVSSTTVANFGTVKITSGKWYFEFRKNADGDNQFGIASGNAYGTSNNYGVTVFRRAWRDSNNTPAWITDGGNAGSGTPQPLATGDILGVALDLDNNAVYFAKNNTWMNSGVPTSGSSKTGAIWTDLSGGVWQIYCGGNANGCYTSLNAGQRPFAYTPPAGFRSLCTTNLPTPTIGATSTTQADNYFNVVARTFTAASATITGLGFSPDFLWFKRRNVAASHSLYDSVRGTNARLLSNDTLAEITTTSAELTSFDSDGFTVGSDPGSISINAANGDTGVVWCWRGSDSAPVTNTSGTITSTVSANTTSGFSVVTYTGTGANATVGHGLGAAPSLIIIKSRSDATGWPVYSSSVGNTSFAYLNTTAAFSVNSTAWNNTSPTSSVFTIGTGSLMNASSSTYVAYCFAPVAGYSAFGSYTGNGSTDGPFIYTGFRPKYVLIKPSSDADNWQVEDAARSPFNVVNDQLWPNLSDAEQVDSTTRQTDFVSNGFKIRGTNTGVNGNGTTYIYAAFAEFPFKYANAR
jgi:hypothetical protein